MKRREVRWERMFPDELEAAMTDFPVVWFSYGLCEPHGPQNAVGLDALKAHAIVCKAAERFGGIVTPPDYWHVHEHAGYAVWSYENVGEVRPWLTAVPAWHHFKTVCYQLRAADALGFKGALLVTGHYGPNWQDLKTIIDIISPHMAMKAYGLPDFEANTPGFDNNGKSGGDHAGKVETSLLWSLEPECVDVSRMPPKGTEGHHFAMGKDAYLSDRKVGERMVEDEIAWLGNKARDLVLLYDNDPTERKPSLTFSDIERIWADEIQPKVGEFESLKEFHGEQDIPADSMWNRQRKVDYE